ncbi:MAG: dipeptide ABC transporter ATP-binding protein [Chloroflexi bacterium]|nr:dipeptide ABC transporter ATP-binding protein [Chloroflexota bacterium]
MPLPPAVPRPHGRCLRPTGAEADRPRRAAPGELLALLGGRPVIEPATATTRPLLQVQNLVKHYPIVKGALFKKQVGTVRAVDDVSFTIDEGETLGLVGESGCGKTTAGRCIVRAIQPTGGSIQYRDATGDEVDVATLEPSQLRPLRREIQMVFQDPYSSLDPRMRISDIVGEPLMVNHVAAGRELRDRVAELLRRVGLRPEYMTRYPHAFSGGERQRIGIARALALNPRFIVADEPVSALDVSVQAQILNLLQELQQQLHLTYLFIAHDLSVVEHISNRVAVMYVGKIVEMAETEELYGNPKHPYTQALLSAVPKPDPRLRSKRILLRGEVADASNVPSGCYFHPRCSYADDRCSRQAPQLEENATGHLVSCHRATELSLVGVPMGPRVSI